MGRRKSLIAILSGSFFLFCLGIGVNSQSADAFFGTCEYCDPQNGCSPASGSGQAGGTSCSDNPQHGSCVSSGSTCTA